MAIVWKVDNVALPRNPDSFTINYDKAAVSYERQAQGNQVRLATPFPISGADFVMTWKNADRKTLNRVMSLFNPLAYNLVHTITIDGIQPAQQVLCWFDTPQKTMSSDVVDQRLGAGGVRHDLTVTTRMVDPYYRSISTVSSAQPPVAATITSMFGGSMSGTDGVPVWNGSAWNVAIGAASTSVSISNLGTAPWSPTIRFNGPFGNMQLNQTYTDLDGTAQGTAFQWTGTSIAAGNYVLFDTYFKRCYSVLSGVKTEVYTFKVFLISDNSPASFWPPVPSGKDNAVAVVASAYGVGTTVDFSNSATELFRYW